MYTQLYSSIFIYINIAQLWEKSAMIFTHTYINHENFQLFSLCVLPENPPTLYARNRNARALGKCCHDNFPTTTNTMKCDCKYLHANTTKRIVFIVYREKYIIFCSGEPLYMNFDFFCSRKRCGGFRFCGPYRSCMRFFGN